jgi:hypothetical protein
MNAALSRIERLDTIQDQVKRIRVEMLDGV